MASLNSIWVLEFSHPVRPDQHITFHYMRKEMASEFQSSFCLLQLKNSWYIYISVCLKDLSTHLETAGPLRKKETLKIRKVSCQQKRKSQKFRDGSSSVLYPICLLYIVFSCKITNVRNKNRSKGIYLASELRFFSKIT